MSRFPTLLFVVSHRVLYMDLPYGQVRLLV
jgi:hypothetical protein